jgi:FMN phosphatase YigB (HAD superfamily)
MKPAVLFDLGNTLAAYYRTDEFGPILERAIAEVHRALTARGMTRVALDAAQLAAVEENHEAPDHRFTPLSERLERIFDITLGRDPEAAAALCRFFLRPVFAAGRLYDDTLQALERLRDAGCPVGIVSNAP